MLDRAARITGQEALTHLVTASSTGHCQFDYIPDNQQAAFERAWHRLDGSSGRTRFWDKFPQPCSNDCIANADI